MKSEQRTSNRNLARTANLPFDAPATDVDSQPVPGTDTNARRECGEARILVGSPRNWNPHLH
jgi:hypothetical protein